MDIVQLLISLVSGAAGGNIAGAAVSSEKNLGTLANTLIGLVGGGAGDFLLKALGVLASSGAAATTTAATAATTAATNGLDLSSILANIGVSGVSGGILTAVIALVKHAIDKK